MTGHAQEAPPYRGPQSTCYKYKNQPLVLYIKPSQSYLNSSESLFIYLTLPKTFNRFTNRHLDDKHGQEWQGHHNSVNQLLWALCTIIIHTIIT